MAKQVQENPGGAEDTSTKRVVKITRAMRRGRVNLERPDLLPIDEQPTITAGASPRRDEILGAGRIASKMNLGRHEYDRENLPKHRGRSSMYKGREWTHAERVEDEHAMMGIIPPESVIIPSRRAMMV